MQSGQQCCYHANGNLATTPPAAGSVDYISPKISIYGHFVEDVLPYLRCCVGSTLADCEMYHIKRPSDKGERYKPGKLMNFA